MASNFEAISVADWEFCIVWGDPDSRFISCLSLSMLLLALNIVPFHLLCPQQMRITRKALWKLHAVQRFNFAFCSLSLIVFRLFFLSPFF